MKYSVLICGGGSTYTLPMIKMLCEHLDVFSIERIILQDIDINKTSRIFEAAKVVVSLLAPSISIEMVENVEEIQGNVQFVFMQIRAGGLAMREKDEKIPLAYDCVGQETCGAGGFAYGIRSIGNILQLVKEIRQKWSSAWIINYSNPAAIVAEATKRVFPNDDRLINLCDMPIAMMDGFAAALNTTRQKLSPRYFGLNHFGWFTHLYDESGNDRLPEIRASLKKQNTVPEELKNDSGWVHTFEQLGQMVNDLDGHIPNTYLQYYLYPNAMVQAENKNYTRANQVMDHRLKQVEEMCDYIIRSGKVEGSGLEKGVHGTYIVEFASAILNNENRIFLVIVKNKGIISNFSYDAMVEVPCIVNANGCEPLHVGEIDTFYKGLMEQQYAYEKLTVDFFLESKQDTALKALALNRTVGDLDIAKPLLKDLIEANQGYWPALIERSTK